MKSLVSLCVIITLRVLLLITSELSILNCSPGLAFRESSRGQRGCGGGGGRIIYRRNKLAAFVVFLKQAQLAS